MGKYYSRRKGGLYIYVTGSDELIDLTLFPSELNLFESDASWKISPNMAICNAVSNETFKKAEEIIKKQGFKRRILKSRTLENSFLTGRRIKLSELSSPPKKSRSRVAVRAKKR